MFGTTLPPNPAPSWRVPAFYVLTLAVVVVGFLLVRQMGERLPVPEGPVADLVRPSAPKSNLLPRLLLALGLVVLLGRVASAALARVGQPSVMGEVLAGILLGPSLLGREASEAILPANLAPALGLIAQLGVLLYLFLVGLELDLAHVVRQAHATVAISHVSIVVPFSLGAGLALGLYSSLAPPGVPFTSFALFLGVALSITAFPVLARILQDRGMISSPLGTLSLACAAIDDVTAWCLLALVVGIVQQSVAQAAVVLGLTLLYAAFVLLVVRPVITRAVRAWGDRPLGPGVMAWVLVGVLLSALATEVIGVHALFGAFLLGAAIPHGTRLAADLHRRLEGLVTVLLLPAFFAYTGMRTEIGLVHTLADWGLVAVITAAATLGKFGGTYAAARLAGQDARSSAGLGVLMNTRGLMELIVLNVGLDLGVISPKLFTMLVLMALITTFSTAPLLSLLRVRPGETRPDPSAQ